MLMNKIRIVIEAIFSFAAGLWMVVNPSSVPKWLIIFVGIVWILEAINGILKLVVINLKMKNQRLLRSLLENDQKLNK